MTHKIKPRILRRKLKKRKWKLKRQALRGSVVQPSTTTSQNRKRDRSPPSYSILDSVPASFSDDEWKAVSSFSSMSDDVFLRAVSVVTSERRNAFDIGIVTSNPRSGRLECDLQTPRNLLIPLWYKEDRVLLAVLYGLQQDSDSEVYSCDRVEYLDPCPRDKTSFRNLHRNLMARLTEELLVTRRSTRIHGVNLSVQSMVRSKHVHISAVCGKSRVEYNGNTKRRLAGFPRMGLTRRKLSELQNQTHLLGGLCHRFGMWWDYFKKDTKYVDPLDVSGCTTLLNVVNEVASWWNNARTRSDVVVESYNLIDLHDHIMSMVCRKIGRLKFDVLGDDHDDDSDVCDVSLDFSSHVVVGSTRSTVTLTGVRILPSTTTQPCELVELFVAKNVSSVRIRCGRGSSRRSRTMKISHRTRRLLGLVLEIDATIATSQQQQRSGVSRYKNDYDEDTSDCEPLPLWSAGEFDALDYYFETQDKENVCLRFKDGELRAQIGASTYVVCRFIFYADESRADMYVWEKIDGFYRKEYHKLGIVNESSGDIETILGFLSESFNARTTVWIRNECDVICRTTRKGYLSSIIDDKNVLQRCETLARSLTLWNYYGRLVTYHFVRVFVVRSEFEPTALNHQTYVVCYHSNHSLIP